MQAEQTATGPAFSGTKDQQALAERLFGVFQARGRFFSEHSPIRLTLDQLTEFMQQQEPGADDWGARIDKALTASSKVFQRQEQDGQIIFTTTRAGRLSTPEPAGRQRQMLKQRFAEPEPKREAPRRARREPQPVPVSGVTDVREVLPELLRESRPAETAEPAPSPKKETARAEPTKMPEPAPAAVEALDVAAASQEDLAEAIRGTLSREISVARWGDRWMAEDRVQRFSRGDLRRIEDFLREQDGVASDVDIVQDVLGVRANAPEFDSVRFALNYRLSRETREYEYLGTATRGLWALANQPAIGTSKRKPSEIGQDYRFLLDYRTPDEGLEEGLIEHILSFYEYTYGVLPLDANIAALMPEPGFPEQRAARITFESPQTTETVVAELRFPTGNRGGFIAGLEQFFADNLVPGGVVTIESTDQPDRFLMEYFQVSGEDRKLLHLDERKGKYTFRSTTYYCATQDEFVLSENRFPKLADAKPLDDRVRRRPEQVLAVTFERIGENVGSPAEPQYWAAFTDLLAVANIERPISAELLRDILTSGTYQEFRADETTEDAFFYTPAAS